MNKTNCINCNKRNAELNFSNEVEVVEKSVAVKDWGADPYSRTDWNLNRKFEISGSICNSCLKTVLKKQKSSDLSFGIGYLCIFILSVFVLIFTLSKTDAQTTWIMLIFILLSGFGSYFFLKRYFKLSDEQREQKEAERIIETKKKEIVENRKKNKLCEICGTKGNFEISIYYQTQNPNPSLFDIPCLRFFRCRHHVPTMGEFENLREKSFKISVSRL